MIGNCNFTCENHKVEGQKVVLSTINVFFKNKRKISVTSVRKDNVASFKKQKRETCFFVIFFDNNFVPTLMYVTWGGGNDLLNNTFPLDQFPFFKVFIILS